VALLFVLGRIDLEINLSVNDKIWVQCILFDLFKRDSVSLLKNYKFLIMLKKLFVIEHERIGFRQVFSVILVLVYL